MLGKNKITKKISLIFLIFLYVANVLAWNAVFELNKPKNLETHFFYIGEGDAILIETPGQNQILIDGGPNNLILDKLSKELPFFDRTIELVILTHPEQDHLEGLLEVLKNYKVENIIWTGVLRDTTEFKEWQNLIEKEGARILYGKKGIKVTENNLFLIFLYPLKSLVGNLVKDSNDTSLVLKLEFDEIGFLFTGDITKLTEDQLILNYEDPKILKSDILKVAHHGSKTSSSERFLEKTLPTIAVVSAGKNNQFGHPHPEVLEKIKKYGAQIFRTDLQGDITIITNGKDLIYEISGI